MRAAFLLALLGCTQDPEPSSEFCYPEPQLEITKHVRDGERYERAGMIGEADREFWLAELKLFGLRDGGMRELAKQVRRARLELRGRR